MFGHLKAEEFMDLIENGSIAAARRAHLSSCTACESRLQSAVIAYRDVSGTDANVPEPEWNDFRNSVRTTLLSRSVQRDSAIRRWTGWSIRPAVAWGLCMMFLVCIGTGGFLWHVSRDSQKVLTGASGLATGPSTSDSTSDIESDVSAWTKTGVFEELAQLQGPQAEQLRQLLQSAQKGSQDPHR